MSLLLRSPVEFISPLDSSKPSIPNDLFVHHGRQIIAHFINKRMSNYPVPDTHSLPETLESSLRAPQKDAPPTEPEPVGILGAGAAGLYIALILLDLGIPFKIIEARERVGGRLYTHIFPDKTGAPYNYYDVGAMRFPQLISMRRLFHLFEYRPLNQGDIQLKEKLTPYYFSNPNALMSYNGETLKQSAVQPSSFQPKAVIQDVGDPTPYVLAGYKRIIDDVLDPFSTRLWDDLRNNTNTGWEYMQTFDHCSARAYMAILYRPTKDLGIPILPLSNDVVNWVETFDTSTGSYDRGLSETVLDTIAFGPDPDAKEETKWWCIKGGAFQIADAMYQYLKRTAPGCITFNQRVTGIKTVRDPGGPKAIGVDVTTDDGTTERFSHVITSIPLPVLRTVDLTDADLNPMQSNALRLLTYGPSTKIGMQFQTAWWTTAKNRHGDVLNIVGGQTYSDSPLRTVVYPSFGDVEEGKTTTLIASYCWTDDAERLGALTSREEMKPVLVDLVVRELARIHDLDVAFLRDQLIDTHAWSWSHDPCTMGAFAFFGPGKFNDVYESLTSPAAGGHLHFAGEAISTRHAWVEGALDSAWRAVYELLHFEPAWQQYFPQFFKNWGYNGEWFSAPPPPDQDGGRPSGEPEPGHRGPVLGVPMGQWDPREYEDENGEPDVDKLLKSSLLPMHILVSHPTEGFFRRRS